MSALIHQVLPRDTAARAAVTVSQIMDALETVCKREGLTLPKAFAAKIAANSRGNLRRAILMLETSKVQRCVSWRCLHRCTCARAVVVPSPHSVSSTPSSVCVSIVPSRRVPPAPVCPCVCRYPFAPEQPLQLPDWERFVNSVALDILNEQSPRQLLAVRAKLYQLLMNCIPASTVMKVCGPLDRLRVKMLSLIVFHPLCACVSFFFASVPYRRTDAARGERRREARHREVGRDIRKWPRFPHAIAFRRQPRRCCACVASRSTACC